MIKNRHDQKIDKYKLRVAHFSFGDDYGAFLAAYELHKTLLEMDIESVFFVRRKTRDDDSIVKLEYTDSKEERLLRVIDKLYFDMNRRNVGIAPIHFDGVGIDLNEQLKDRLSKYDIFHIHWVTGLLNIDNIVQLSKLNKQIVWTMHDFHPFTGGCHYPEFCEKYKNDCSNCHELESNSDNITKYVLSEKQYKYPSSINIIAASNWLKDIIKESSVFKKNLCEVIPIGIDTKCFVLKNKDEIKNTMHISLNSKIMLLGAQSLKQNIKGYINVKKIINIIEKDIYCRELINKKQLFLMIFGSDGECLEYCSQIPVINMGFIQNRAKLCDIYSVADVFIFPSVQDTFGMTAVEAMSCGVPTVSFNTGAMKEVIVSGVNGYKAEINDFETMASCVIHIIKNDPIDKNKCRKYIVDNFDLKCEAINMLQFYQKVVTQNHIINNSEDDKQENKEIIHFINKCAFDILTGNFEVLKDILLEYSPEFVSPEQKIKKLIHGNRIDEKMSIYIYGAGNFGRRTLHELKKYKMNIKGFWDYDKNKEGKYIEKYCINRPRKKVETDKVKIIIAGTDYLNMIVCMIRLGYIYIDDFF